MVNRDDDGFPDDPKLFRIALLAALLAREPAMASAVMIEVGVFRPESGSPPFPIISVSMGDMIPALSAVNGLVGVPGFDAFLLVSDA